VNLGFLQQGVVLQMPFLLPNQQRQSAEGTEIFFSIRALMSDFFFVSFRLSGRITTSFNSMKCQPCVT